MVNSPEGRAALDRQQTGSDPTDKAITARKDEYHYNELPRIVEEQTALTRPDGSDPEAFYRLVAARYTATLADTAKVAPVLAAEAGVPIPTVHRWIAEARRRGFLAPARQGKAG